MITTRSIGCSPAGAQMGISLVELMIAMTLGLILTLGVLQVFLGSSQTYRLSDALGKLQEDIRFSMGRLQYDARMAGHFGCLIGEPFNQLDTTDPAYDEAIFNTRGVRGWEAGGTGIGDAYEIEELTAGAGNWSNGSGDNVPAALQGQIVNGTDFIIMRDRKST